MTISRENWCFEHPCLSSAKGAGVFCQWKSRPLLLIVQFVARHCNQTSASSLLRKRCAMEALQISKRRRKLLARIYICHRKRGLGCTASTSTRMSMPRLPSKLCTCGDITTSKQQMCINCHIRTSKLKSLTL